MSKTRYQFPTVPTPQIDPTAVTDKTRLGLAIFQISSFASATKTALDTIAQQFYSGSNGPPVMYQQKSAPDPGKCYEGDLWWDTGNSALMILYNSKWIAALDVAPLKAQIAALEARIAAVERHFDSGGPG